ncbi:MAG: deoxyribonuclease V [Candidatus Sericytochromatia bacterium]|nr:deoxyribonuclease V [Candidatus Sericytochromatia bacterium]
MLIPLSHEHPWDVAPYEAQQLQRSLQGNVQEIDLEVPPRTIAGVEVAHSRFSDILVAAVSVLRLPDLTVVEEVTAEYSAVFPFIPGLLSFREVPAVLEALARLEALPDALIVDGPGVAHPHGLGVASHLGVLLNRPTIGCSRSALVGSYVEPEVSAGSQSALVWQGELIGTVYRSKNRVAPLFVSVGHRVTRATALEMVVACCKGYRLPEPTRRAHARLTEARQALRTDSLANGPA